MVPNTGWTLFNNPAAATQATATKAAVPSMRHVISSLSWTLSAGATAQAAALSLVVRDGPSGTGTILWGKQGIIPINGLWEGSISDLNITGSIGNAMTIEFTAAGAAGTFQSFTACGHDMP